MAYRKLKCPVFAVGTYTDGSAPTYANGVTVGKLMSANMSFTYSDSKLYGDDVLVLQDASMTGGEITMQVTHLLPEIEAAMLNGTAGSGTATEYNFTDKAPAYGGFGFVRGGKKDDGTDVYTGYWFYKTVWSLSSDNATTRGDSGDYQSPELKGTVMGCYIDSTGVASYYCKQDFTTEAAALSYVKGKAGIGA